MLLRQLFDTESSTYTYLLGDRESGEAALIDPVRENVDRDLKLIDELDLRLVLVLDTHMHADHVTGAGDLRARTGAKTVGGISGAACTDIHVGHGDVVRVGKTAITALATPGHTDDSVSYTVTGFVFTGDALLIRGCGRTDFQNGNAGDLFDTITKVLFSLPDETVVYPGHDYKGMTASTIGEEKRFNPRFAGKSKDAFITLMGNLNLAPPTKLDVAVIANRACGRIEQSA